MKTTLTTHSGSRYVVEEREDGTFWLSGENVPNPGSLSIDGGVWEIRRPLPWPIQLEDRVLLMSTHYDTPDEPRRLPGGGKYISPVQSIEIEE